MRYLTFILLIFSLPGFAQITGNPHVKDSSAIKLDAAAVNQLNGKWKLIETVEFIRNEEPERVDRGLIIDFAGEGHIITSWCMECHQERAGQWEILNEQTININSQPENKYLAGEWVVYRLTDEEMVLAKVLTSTGDWKKMHYFSRDVNSPAITETNHYCINCTSDNNWCWGDRPEGAKKHWIIVNDLTNEEGDQDQYAAKISESIDWLLANAPCINNYLYVKAMNHYKNLLNVEKKEQTRKVYEEKLAHIKEQQLLYFKE